MDSQIMDGHTSLAKGDVTASAVSDLETNSGPAHLIDSLEFTATEESSSDRCSSDAYSPLTPANSETQNLVDDDTNSTDSEGHSFSQHSEQSQGETIPQTDVASHVSNLIDSQSQDADRAMQSVPLAGDHIQKLAEQFVGQLITDTLSHMALGVQESNESSGHNTCMSACYANPMPTADSVNTSAMHAATNLSSSSSESASESDSSLSSNQSASKANANRRKKKNNRKKTNSNSSPSSTPVAVAKGKTETTSPKVVDSSLPKTSPAAVEKPKVNGTKVETNLAKKTTASPKSVSDTSKASPKSEPKCQTSPAQSGPKLNGVCEKQPKEVKTGAVQSDAFVASPNQTSNDKPSSEPKVEDLPCELTNSKQSSESSLVSEASTDQSMEYADSKTKPSGGKSFGQNVPGESMCKICAKHVYHMEQIKAVKAVFHKSCFRCSECNKQLNVDSYSSHEGVIYCKPHFKQLFQPKAVFENEESKQKPPARKHELIICENTPQELPADVVRSCDKQDDIFENINLDLSNIRNRFENHTNEKSSPDAKKSNEKLITRSESIHKIMQKYQNRVSGDNDNSSSDDEENTKTDGEKEQKLAFSGMSALKSQWESGSISANSKSENRVEEELAELRQKHPESLKQAYERAVQEAKSVENLSSKSDNFVVDSSVKAVSIKEKFEKGNLESEEDRIERLRKQREEEINRIAGSETKDARNKFKQIEANMGKDQVPNGNNSQMEDVSISSNELQQRFQYFENLKDSQQPLAKEHFHDEVDDIPKADTTKKMLDKFKALEAGQTNGQSNGVPKSPKRVTPPRETAVVYESEPVRDENIVRSSYKSEENIQVEPEKAKNLKAKFENWQTEIERENRKNNYEEEEYVPHIDTTKNLRAMFETAKDDFKPVEKARPRINRFVDSNKASSGEVCCVCSARLYPMEKMEFSGLKIHKNCFRCNKCHAPLRLDNFTVRAEKLFCIPHFKQLFMEKGNYDEGFGLEQHKDKWSHKDASVKAPVSNGKSNGVDKLNGNDLNNGHDEAPTVTNGNGTCHSDQLTDDHSTEGEEESPARTNQHEEEEVDEQDEQHDQLYQDEEEDQHEKESLELDEVLDGPIPRNPEPVDEQLVESH